MKNITNKTKTILFASLITAMILPFSGMNYAEAKTNAYDPDKVSRALEDLEPFVVVNNKKFAKLDIASATINGISKETIKIGQEYLQIQNKMIKNVQNNSNKKIETSSDEKQKFKKFFDKVKNTGTKENNVRNVSYLDFLVPVAYASHGCNYNGPHGDSTTSYHGNYATRTAAKNALPSGYNPVPNYASNPDQQGNDYSDWVVAYGCLDGVFRNQIVLDQDGSTWQHVHDENPAEPNPEVLSYTWPVYWWAWYVEDWHDAN